MKRVLIVEDDAVVAWDHALLLTSEGYDTVAAATVESALERIRAAPPHAAVLDASVRRCSTEPIARELEVRSIPYVICMGHPRSLEWNAQAVEIQTKPCRPEVLTAAIRKALG